MTRFRSTFKTRTDPEPLSNMAVSAGRPPASVGGVGAYHSTIGPEDHTNMPRPRETGQSHSLVLVSSSVRRCDARLQLLLSVFSFLNLKQEARAQTKIAAVD